MNRKKFLSISASVAGAMLAANPLKALSSGAADTNQLPLIDTHQHLWDIERFKEGWSVPPFGRSFNMTDYEEAVEGLNMVKSVYMEVAVPPAKRREEALYAIEVCRDTSNNTVGAVIAGDPVSNEFEAYIREFEGSPYIKGIRYFFRREEEINSQRVMDNIALLGRLNMHFEFSVPPKWLSAITRLRASCPETPFAVNHCGNLDPRVFFKKEELRDAPDHDLKEWTKNMRLLASAPNTICKISGIVTRVPGYQLTPENLAPSIDLCLDLFGPERVVFATDWPVCLKAMEIRTWVGLLKNIVERRSYDEQKKLFHDNAIRFYKL